MTFCLSQLATSANIADDVRIFFTFPAPIVVPGYILAYPRVYH